MIDQLDATHDKLRLAVSRALTKYSLQELFECCTDSCKIVRTTAARELHIRGGQESFEFAKAITASRRFDHREIGAFVLGQLGTPICPYATESINILTKLIADDYFEVRAAAIGAIGFLASLGHEPDTQTITKMIEIARDEDIRVRTNLAFALGSMDSTIAAAFLQQMKSDRNEQVLDAVDFAIQMHDQRQKQK